MSLPKSLDLGVFCATLPCRRSSLSYGGYEALAMMIVAIGDVGHGGRGQFDIGQVDIGHDQQIVTVLLMHQ